MARKSSQTLSTEVFYGWNAKTGKVERVWYSSDRRLSWTRPDGSMFSHFVASGRDPASEVRLVFALTDVFGVPPQSVNDEWVSTRVAELQKNKLPKPDENGREGE